ncbi:MAG: type pilus assembly protein PilA [Frankiales bacterium]|nr:type pilus assembly protein PilA [Frankiales bacterium]
MLNRLRARVSEGREAGFTLIELLIVIVILGILAAIVVFAVGSARDDSVKASCKADTKTINTASEAYKAKNGAYAADMATLQSGGFIKSVPPNVDYKITYTAGTATGAIGVAGAGGPC